MKMCSGCYSTECFESGKCKADAVKYECGTVASGPGNLPSTCPVHKDCSAIKGKADNAKQADAALDSFRGSEPVTFGVGQSVTFEPVKAEPTNQMYQSLKATFSKCLGICERKSHDYARGENPYRNFETVTRLGVSVQQGLLIRTLDKITRLENLLTVAPYVTEETFEDTIDDAINYLAILKARREFERSTK